MKLFSRVQAAVLALALTAALCLPAAAAEDSPAAALPPVL